MLVLHDVERCDVCVVSLVQYSANLTLRLETSGWDFPLKCGIFTEGERVAAVFKI